MPTVRTCLWFDDAAEEAARYYVSVVDGAELGGMEYPPEGAPHTVPGVPITVELTIGGQRYQLLNGGPHIQPSEFASISVECETQAEADRYWAALTADGGEESQCGWLKDRWGISWQILPAECRRLMADPATAERAFAAMLTMKRLDAAAMRSACGR